VADGGERPFAADTDGETAAVVSKRNETVAVDVGKCVIGAFEGEVAEGVTGVLLEG
jgi:hypothetical protein